MFRSSMDTDARKIARHQGNPLRWYSCGLAFYIVDGRNRGPGATAPPACKKCCRHFGHKGWDGTRVLGMFGPVCVVSSYGEGEKHLQQESRDSRQEYPAVVRTVVLVLEMIGVGGEKR